MKGAGVSYCFDAGWRSGSSFPLYRCVRGLNDQQELACRNRFEVPKCFELKWLAILCVSSPDAMCRTREAVTRQLARHQEPNSSSGDFKRHSHWF